MTRLAVVALIASVALASCGGDDGGASKKPDAGDSAVQAAPSTSAAGGARVRYIARIDAICRAANARLAPIRAKLAKVDNGRRSKGEVFARFHQLSGQAASIADNVFGQIDDVPPPAADREAVASIKSLLARQVTLLHGLAAAAGRRDAGAIQRLNVQITGVNNSYRSATRAFGFKICGQSG